MKKNKYRQSVVLHKLKTGMIKPYFRLNHAGLFTRVTSQSPCLHQTLANAAIT